MIHKVLVFLERKKHPVTPDTDNSLSKAQDLLTKQTQKLQLIKERDASQANLQVH